MSAQWYLQDIQLTPQNLYQRFLYPSEFGKKNKKQSLLFSTWCSFHLCIPIISLALSFSLDQAFLSSFMHFPSFISLPIPAVHSPCELFLPAFHIRSFLRVHLPFSTQSYPVERPYSVSYHLPTFLGEDKYDMIFSLSSFHSVPLPPPSHTAVSSSLPWNNTHHCSFSRLAEKE